MDLTHRLVEAHEQDLPQPAIDPELLENCIRACAACAQACTICAGATGDDERAACLSTAEMCRALMRMLLRPKAMRPDVVTVMLQTAVARCTLTREECAAHADGSADSRLCADACRECATACKGMLDYLRSVMQWA